MAGNLDQKLTLEQMQTRWGSVLSPLLGSPIATPTVLEKVQLSAGTNVIDHKLDRALRGWFLVRQRGPATATTDVTDWISFTPTGSWSTNATYTGFWRRVGDSMQVIVRVATAGAPTGGTLTVNVPSGFAIDTAKLTSAALDMVVGGAIINDSSTTYYLGSVVATSSASVTPRNLGNTTPGIAMGSVSATNPITFGNGDSVTLNFLVPISGWSISDSSFVQCYDVQDSNSTPDKTLVLVSSGSALVDLIVF